MGVDREPGAEEQEGGTLVQIFEANQREISPILGFKLLIREYLSAEFVNRVCRTLFISRPARDSLKECIGKFVQSLSKYLLDANKNVNMLDSFELD